MKIEVLEQKKNPLLKRDELSIGLEHPGKATPSRKEILPELAKALKSKEELLIIDKIFSVPGRSISKARVLAYSKREEIPREKLEKMKGRMEPKKAGVPKEEGKSPEEKKQEGGAPSEEKSHRGPKPEEQKKEAPAEEKPRPEEKKGGE